MMDALATARVLWWRDLVRFFRQPSRVVGAVGQPILFWLFFGAGFQRSFQVPGLPGQDYRAFFFPGVLAMTLLFTAIFATVSVIEDRREGFLQAVLAGPAPAWSIALGKILGGASLAMVQAGLLLLLAPLFGTPVPLAALPALLGIMVVTAVGLTALSFAIAWSMRSSQGYHAVMSLFLIPLWLLSGSMFPISGTAGPLAAVMRANPLSHAVDAMRRLLHGGEAARAASGIGGAASTQAALLILMAVALCALAGRRAHARRLP
jgi:ABC-2 type transport system permease protein